MPLKNARLTRAELLSDRMQSKLHGGDKGLVIIETTNHDLKAEPVLVTEKGGIREYLLRLGKFKETQT